MGHWVGVTGEIRLGNSLEREKKWLGGDSEKECSQQSARLKQRSAGFPEKPTVPETNVWVTKRWVRSDTKVSELSKCKNWTQVCAGKVGNLRHKSSGLVGSLIFLIKCPHLQLDVQSCSPNLEAGAWPVFGATEPHAIWLVDLGKAAQGSRKATAALGVEDTDTWPTFQVGIPVLSWFAL